MSIRTGNEARISDYLFEEIEKSLDDLMRWSLWEWKNRHMSRNQFYELCQGYMTYNHFYAAMRRGYFSTDTIIQLWCALPRTWDGNTVKWSSFEATLRKLCAPPLSGEQAYWAANEMFYKFTDGARHMTLRQFHRLLNEHPYGPRLGIDLAGIYRTVAGDDPQEPFTFPQFWAFAKDNFTFSWTGTIVINIFVCEKPAMPEIVDKDAAAEATAEAARQQLREWFRREQLETFGILYAASIASSQPAGNLPVPRRPDETLEEYAAACHLRVLEDMSMPTGHTGTGEPSTGASPADAKEEEGTQK